MARVEFRMLDEFVREVESRIVPREPSVRAGAFLICLEGELGAGKTTFMQTFAKALGVTETLQSPTFVLMKNYPIQFNGFTKLVHIDAYRLEGASEFQPLKPEEFLPDAQAIVCIEWPEKVSGALPLPDLVLQFSHREGEMEARDIEIKTDDRRQA